jgi:hypothetical protein
MMPLKTKYSFKEADEYFNSAYCDRSSTTYWNVNCWVDSDSGEMLYARESRKPFGAYEYSGDPSNPIKETYYYVMRTYSAHYVKERLVRVFSARLKDRRTAEQWMSYCESQEKNKKHEYFIVQTDSEVVP